ncbi:HD-GYP domain-containing protein [Desulfosporosinus youngiae]|uniref:HD-GYP domain-containing protein n=1 Tax=Desulfosporosinus youngiae DSM 17734 TaxID=768710 RepID=H5XSS7_9FIRM|nr:HD-GYP domain-containing protein [Desulfosporosinus youngiae]EHQ87745.1 HD-GYP domain-containing protein [Desulfosporosinus youngiae DSM 17734]
MFQFIQRFLRQQHFHDIIECLATALEAKDLYTSGHSSRVGDMSYDLGRAMGLKGLELENIHIAAHLHDIGKMGISETILNKRDRLLPHEWAQIQTHPEIGYKILAKSKGLKEIAEIVLHHHERWDGKGYPSGLRENEIPLGSRIIGVADSIDAITSARPYRKALSWEECWDEILLNKGIQFDPLAVEATEKLLKKWRAGWLGSQNKGVYREPRMNGSVV